MRAVDWYIATPLSENGRANCEAGLICSFFRKSPNSREISMTDLEQRREALINQIKNAFTGVDRKGGVSLHEADVIDDKGSLQERIRARQLDAEHKWEDVPEADIERYDWILSFLDPIGFRYYLPAYMIWTLRHYANSESMSVDSTIYALDYGDHFREFAMKRFLLFDRAQKEAVCTFLRFMVKEAAGLADETAATSALNRYWGQFC
jgi:hypothetical protein